LPEVSLRSSFTPTDTPNPHLQRTRRILRAHPTLRRFYRTYPPTALWIAAIVIAQLVLATWLADKGWLWVLAASWLLGAPAGHALFVLLHEAAHDLIVKPVWANKALGILCNVGQGLPAALPFRKYHLLHHSHMGEYDQDGDLPFRIEARLVGSSPLGKIGWYLLFPLIEIARPLRMKQSAPDAWTIANIVVILAFDVALGMMLGARAPAYLLLSTFFGVGLHPLGARWIQEHYTFREGQETYSYYGPANRIAFNVGHHNEHHDLARVPWVDLPKVRAEAPEFYDTLHSHGSWTRLLLQFLFDRDIDLFARITREGRRSLVEKPKQVAV
jgi:sphingolipid delta-4 desaturase